MKLVYLDTETTSLEDGRLVQLCVKGPEEDELINALFKPPVPIEFEAMAVHHVTEKMVADKPAFVGAYRDQAAEPLTENIVVAHNAPFDVGVLEREGVVIPKWICTKKVAMRLWPDWPSHKLQVIRYRLGIEIDAGNAHDALADVLVLERVFEAMVEEAKRQLKISVHLCGSGDAEDYADVGKMAERGAVIDAMLRWSREPSLLHAFTFGKHKGKTFQDVAVADPGYLRWLLGEENFDEDVKHSARHWLEATRPKPAPSPQGKLI